MVVAVFAVLHRQRPVAQVFTQLLPHYRARPLLVLGAAGHRERPGCDAERGFLASDHGFTSACLAALIATTITGERGGQSPSRARCS
jgi:hypothetical protein